MNTQQAWETIAKLPVGTIVSWGAVIIGILVAVFKGIGKLYGLFKEYKRKEDEEILLQDMITEHDRALDDFRNSLERIESKLEEQKDVNMKQIRYTIVHTCDDAIADGYISAGKLKSLEEMFEEYTNVFNGNGYVKVLVEKTRLLPVRGKLDE